MSPRASEAPKLSPASRSAPVCVMTLQLVSHEALPRYSATEPEAGALRVPSPGAPTASSSSPSLSMSPEATLKPKRSAAVAAPAVVVEIEA